MSNRNVSSDGIDQQLPLDKSSCSQFRYSGRIGTLQTAEFPLESYIAMTDRWRNYATIGTLHRVSKAWKVPLGSGDEMAMLFTP